jgi:hypothetical protein
MPIYPDIPKEFTRCKDGSYSSSQDVRACSWHGGRVDGKNVLTSSENSAEVFLIPLNKISTRTSIFQGREKEFSQRSVDNILNAIKSGSFKWANLDPVILWSSPKYERYIVLSGHSRKEAFRRAASQGLTAQGKKFDEIPAKLFYGTEQEAKEIALKSNTLGTSETVIERANYYRQKEGVSYSELLKEAKELEGRNARTVLALARLNPSGKFYQALRQFEGKETTDSKNILDSARWVGSLRWSVPALTNTHENELFDWLINQGFYRKLGNARKFNETILSVINSRTTFGKLDESLNLNKYFSKSPTEQRYDEQVEALKSEVKELEKTLRDKINDLSKRGATEPEIRRIVEGIEATLRRKRIELQKLLQDKSKILEQAKKEKTLFDTIGQAPGYNLPGGFVAPKIYRHGK